MTTNDSIISLQHSQMERARRLAFWGLLARWEEVKDQPWLEQLLTSEEEERKHRSMQNRLQNSHIGKFKSIVDFCWTWPEKIDRLQIEELFTLRFMAEISNVVLLGPNGVGKTMIAQNLAYQALLKGYTVLFTSAAKMLGDLASQEVSSSLNRRLQHYCRPTLLVVDEVGYLSYNNRHADLLFELVTRRYTEKPTIITTNRVFKDWNEVFPNAACVVTLIDRLVHNSEIVEIKAESYRLKEAKERAAQRASRRGRKPVADKSAQKGTLS